MREGSYITGGEKVHFTDAATVALASDLYQYIEHDYHGSDSVDSTRLEAILQHLQAGMPLQAAEWDILRELKERLGKGFEKWRNDGREGQAAQIPEGSGRLSPVEESGGYKSDSTTKRDREITPAHLIDGAMHDFAHAKQHADRLLHGDVRGNKAAVEFNHEHMLKHIVSGIDHLSRARKHLEQYASSPKIFAQERQQLEQLKEDAPHSPPGLEQPSRHEPEHCGSCRMFDPTRHVCWSYELPNGQDYPVNSGDWCRSWAESQTGQDIGPDMTDQTEPSLVKMALAAKQLRRDTVEDQTALTIASPDKSEPTVCVDFDGVLHQGSHGLPGRVGGTLIDGSKEGLQKIKDMGYRIVVLTARVDLEAVRDWLIGEGLGKLIDEVTNRKPAASAYIDDRATHFTNWKDAVQAVNPLTPISEHPKATNKVAETSTLDRVLANWSRELQQRRSA